MLRFSAGGFLFGNPFQSSVFTVDRGALVLRATPAPLSRRTINDLQMSKFAHCHYANGLMWCQHHNGSWAPPVPASPKEENEKPPKEEDDSKE